MAHQITFASYVNQSLMREIEREKIKQAIQIVKSVQDLMFQNKCLEIFKQSYFKEHQKEIEDFYKKNKFELRPVTEPALKVFVALKKIINENSPISLEKIDKLTEENNKKIQTLRQSLFALVL